MSTDDMTKIQVSLPLPMDVAGTVMRVIGAAYPTALIEGNGRSMTFLIPEKARPRKVSKAKAKPDEILDPATDLLELGPQGISISTPEHLAAASLEIMQASFDQFPDAKNYLEQRCYDHKTHKAYVMTFQRVEGQTAHELRQEAERKLAIAEARIAELEARP